MTWFSVTILNMGGKTETSNVQGAAKTEKKTKETKKTESIKKTPAKKTTATSKTKTATKTKKPVAGIDENGFRP